MDNYPIKRGNLIDKREKRSAYREEIAFMFKIEIRGTPYLIALTF